MAMPAPPHDPSSPALYDAAQIMQMIPHRPPWLLLDKIIHLDSHTITAVKHVTAQHPSLSGHFPGDPVMPGVLQVEALAQAGGVLVSSLSGGSTMVYLVGVEECRLRRPVRSGDVLTLHCVLAGGVRHGMATVTGSAFVGQTLVAEATLLLRLMLADQGDAVASGCGCCKGAADG